MPDGSLSPDIQNEPERKTNFLGRFRDTFRNRHSSNPARDSEKNPKVRNLSRVELHTEYDDFFRELDLLEQLSHEEQIPKPKTEFNENSTVYDVINGAHTDWRELEEASRARNRKPLKEQIYDQALFLLDSGETDWHESLIVNPDGEIQEGRHRVLALRLLLRLNNPEINNYIDGRIRDGKIKIHVQENN